ncbi:MAG TPA: biotin/lipoyl-containing protein, partial [Acidimicrobiales bacterium]|nr:biotin/lipoyl-containing protein [Acidimicrobiales bacterium]
DGWRSGGPPAPTGLVLMADGERVEVAVLCTPGEPGDQQRRRGRAVVAVGAVGAERRVAVGAFEVEGHRLLVELDDAIERFTVMVEPGAVLVAYRGELHRFEFGYNGRHQGADEDDVVVAPLPGILVDVSVSPGDSVRAGDVLGVLESMKMEYSLKAQAQARVERVGFPAGSRVSRGDVLFELAPVEVRVEAAETGEAVETIETIEAVETIEAAEAGEAGEGA